jgi:hypothetical protein
MKLTMFFLARPVPVASRRLQPGPAALLQPGLLAKLENTQAQLSQKRSLPGWQAHPAAPRSSRPDRDSLAAWQTRILQSP